MRSDNCKKEKEKPAPNQYEELCHSAKVEENEPSLKRSFCIFTIKRYLKL